MVYKIPLPSDNNNLLPWAQSLTSVLDRFFSTLSSPLVPAGTVTLFAGTSPPSGWYLCDGSAKGRKRDSVLFRLVGTTFGAGDGSTTFNLPPADLDGSHSAPTDLVWIIKA